MEVQANAQAGFINIEELPEPRAKEGDHPWIRVGEKDIAIRLGSFRGVQRQPRNQEFLTRNLL